MSNALIAISEEDYTKMIGVFQHSDPELYSLLKDRHPIRVDGNLSSGDWDVLDANGCPMSLHRTQHIKLKGKR